MKKIAIVVLLALFVFNVSCGSSTVSSDTTPREAKVIALTGTLMALIAQTSAGRAVAESMGAPTSGTIETPIDITYPDLDLEGTPDDMLTVDSGSWTKTTAGDKTTMTMTDISYSSEMIEYPWNNTTPFDGVTISFDDIDFTVTASTDSSGITGLGSATVEGTGAMDDFSPTTYELTSSTVDIGTMTVNVTNPSKKTGTVSFTSVTLGGGIHEGEMTTSAILTAAVGYDGATYSCTIIAGYSSSILPGNTGIGELTVSSATCTDD